MGVKANSSSIFEGTIDRILRGDQLACEIVMITMMILISVEVVSRTFFNYSLQATDEISSYLLVAATFLGIGISLREGALFRVDFLYARFGARLKNLCGFLFSLLSLAFMLLLEYQILRFLVSSIERGITAPTLLATPLYLPQLVMPLGVGIVILVLFSEIWRTFRALRGTGPKKEPI
jgi:TRAP-type C4-dicarboxylate transport system permease small subunit